MSAQRICLTLPSVLPVGGAEMAWLTLAVEFRRCGYGVDFVVAREPDLGVVDLPEGVRTFDLGALRLRSFVAPFIRYLRAERPDVVLSAMWPFTTACVLAARLARTGTPVVVSEQNILSRQYWGRGLAHAITLRACLTLGHRLARARIAVSHGVAKDVARLALMSPKRFTVIHNPILADTTAVVSAASGSVWPSDSRTARVITAGRLKEQKNHRLLIEAFDLLRRERPAHLVILGTGELEGELRAFIESRGLGGTVTLAGHVAQPASWFSTADLFVLSSNYEGFGNVIVEALACGTPVVSTDCPSGPGEILANGAFGTLVPVGDEQALARAMADALSRPHDKDRLRARATDFAPEIAARRYLALLARKDETG